MTELRRIGIVVHPTRPIEEVLAALEGWAQERGAVVVQVGDQVRQVAPAGEVGRCDLVVALGGDGTVLAAMHEAASAGRPVLGARCGSVGALSTVGADELAGALDRVVADDWNAASLPALRVGDHLAFNDLVAVRDGGGQVTVAITVDDVLYGRVAGDGVVVSTPIGSSGYGIAAGGPILEPGSSAYVVTPIAAHAGSVPPIVLAPDTVLHLDIDPGYAGVRYEVDGRQKALPGPRLEVALQPAAGVLVRFGSDERVLTALRRRGIISDSPRVLARDARAAGLTPQA